MSKTESLKARMKALRALHILQSNTHQSVAKAIFHDEVCAFDEELSRLHETCVKALEAGGCQIMEMPMFSDWTLKMDDKAKKTFNYDLMAYMDKSIAKLERQRADAVIYLQGQLRNTA